MPKYVPKIFSRLVWSIGKRILGGKIKKHEDIISLSFGHGPLKHYTLFFPKEVERALQMGMELNGYFSAGSKIIGEGDIIYDGGAWPGDFTVVASQMTGPTGKVFAFEPNPHHRIDLETVLKLNKCKNVEIVPLAFSDKTKMVRFIIDGAGSRIVLDNTLEAIEVESTTLDAFTNQNQKPDLIKLDIEGMEVAMLNESRDTIKRYHPSWAIASYHRTSAYQQTCHLLESRLRENYKNVFTTYPLHKTTFAFN